jgi:tetratricopeptide (TPR) repeat protein
MTDFRILLFLFLLSMSVACRVKNDHVKAAHHHEERLSEKEQLDFSFLFYEAIKDKTLGNFQQAQSKLQQAIRIDPRNDAAHYELSQVYLQTGNADLARMSAELAVKFNPRNSWYKRSLAEIYGETGQTTKQIAMLNDLLEKEPGDTEALYQLGEAYIRVRKFEDALKIYDRIEKREGYSEELAIQKKNLYLKLEKTQKAIDEIRKLIAANPEEPGYYGILAEIYMADNKPAKALEQYDEILKRDPQNPNVHFSLADFYRKQGDNQKSFSELRKAFENPEGDIELKLQVVASYFELIGAFPELKSQVLELCQVMVKVHPQDARAKAILGDYFFMEEKYKDAFAQYEQSISIDKSRFSVWNQLLLTLNELDETKKLNELSTEACALFPQQPVFFLYKGLSFMQLKQYEPAVEAFKEGLLVTVDNKELSVQLLANLGDACHHLKKYAESDEAYESALGYDPQNTYVLNNYAYYLSVRKVKLEKAAALAKRCNELEPGRPSYEDTYAWVLFQSGKASEALVWIEKAIASGGGSNSTIVEHKGDIYWILDKKDLAVESWKQAKQLGGDAQRLDKKIREGLKADE